MNVGINLSNINAQLIENTAMIDYILRESYGRREVYSGHARLCVSLSVRRRMPIVLHGPECNLGEW